MLEKPNSILYLIKTGSDVLKTEQLIKTLKIENNVKYLPPLTTKSMNYFYLQSDVIADQFIIGSMGCISLESLVLGKPLLTYINEDQHKLAYHEIPPVANAVNQSEVFSRLNELYDKKFKDNLAKKGNDWVTKHHCNNKLISKLKTIYAFNFKNIKELQKYI